MCGTFNSEATPHSLLRRVVRHLRDGSEMPASLLVAAEKWRAEEDSRKRSAAEAGTSGADLSRKHYGVDA